MDDHFFDGSTWEIGLKRFAGQMSQPLTLTVLPMRKDAAIYLDDSVGAMVSGDQTAVRPREHGMDLGVVDHGHHHHVRPSDQVGVRLGHDGPIPVRFGGLWAHVTHHHREFVS